MLSIRPDQKEALAQSFVPAYEEQMMEHLRQHFPSKTREAPDDELLEIIRTTQGRAKGCGFETPRSWCRFTNLAVAFGDEFPDSLPWAKAILADTSYPDASAQLHALEGAAVDHLLALEEEKKHRPLPED